MGFSWDITEGHCHSLHIVVSGVDSGMIHGFLGSVYPRFHDVHDAIYLTHMYHTFLFVVDIFSRSCVNHSLITAAAAAAAATAIMYT